MADVGTRHRRTVSCPSSVRPGPGSGPPVAAGSAKGTGAGRAVRRGSPLRQTSAASSDRGHQRDQLSVTGDGAFGTPWLLGGRQGESGTPFEAVSRDSSLMYG